MVTLSPLSLFSGAVADDNTAVYEVFREHFDQLVRAMGTSPTALIPVLYSKRLISDTDKINLTSLTGVGNIDKAIRLLTANLHLTVQSWEGHPKPGLRPLVSLRIVGRVVLNRAFSPW